MENVVGALALALADDLMNAMHAHAPQAGPAAAAIALLRHAPGMTIERLRRALDLSHPGAVRLVDRLVSDGLVMRNPSAIDRRAVALTLTAAGEDACRAMLSARQSALARALEGLAPDDQRAFGRMAETMLRALLRSEDHAYAICRLCDNEVCVDCPVEAELNTRSS